MGGQRTDDGKSRRDGGDGRSPGGGGRRDGGGRKDGGSGDGSGSGRERVVDDGGGGGDGRSRSRSRSCDRDRDRGRDGKKRRGDDDGDSRHSDGGTDRVTEAKGGRGTARGSRSRDRDGGGDDDGASGSLDRRKERSDQHAKNGDRGDDGRTTTRRSRSRSRDRHGDRDRDRGAKDGGSRRRQHGSRRSRTKDRRGGGDRDYEDRRGGGGSRHRRRKRGDDRDGRRRSSSGRRDGGKKKRRRRSSSSSSSTSYSSSSSSGSSSSSSSGSSSSSSTSSSSDRRSKRRRRKHGVSAKKSNSTKRKKDVEVVANERLLSKLASRGETLEEREERRAKRRAERIASRFGYTPEDNPFNDPNLHETFSWKKKEAATAAAAPAAGGGQRRQPPKKKGRKEEQEHILSEIDKVRKRRADREAQQDEMERLRAEESRLRELENYDEWAAKEEEFHLQQQRQRSAIRLLEKREKPVDVLAKNLLLFGLTEEEKTNRARVKYQERYDALAELDTLEAELVEPHELLKDLKLLELQELLGDIEAYRDLEKEAAAAAAKDGAEHDHAASEMIIQYWDNLHLVTRDEIRYVQTGGKGGAHSAVVDDIQQLFEDKSAEALQKMKEEVVSKLNSNETGVDTEYWGSVLSQLDVHRAKEELSDVHNMMLARQLEKLEKRKEALSKLAPEGEEGEAGGAEAARAEEKQEAQQSAALQTLLPSNVKDVNFGNLEESLGLSSEVNLGAASYAWQDKYRPRKPRYFNRVKTGYDWNKYNQTHYDHDNPPPKIVQGYKFNVFYPDLIDKTRTPEYKLEPADTDEFCILRFRAGPPYEDVAFKIINREWNRSRKRGFRCTFERGVLSLYFNFKSHWYRR